MGWGLGTEHVMTMQLAQLTRRCNMRTRSLEVD
jgi:hypothetical protein